MRWILYSVYGILGLLVASMLLTIVFVEETRPIVDIYANHTSVLGLLVSVIGFALTVWTIYETLKVSTKAQQEIGRAIFEARQERRSLLGKIRRGMIDDTCEQALLFAAETRYAIRSDAWLRAAERCDDSRRLAARLLAFPDLTDSERDSIRAIVEDMNATIAFIERARLKKKDAPSGMPDDKRQSVETLIDQLEKIRARLKQRILEDSHDGD